MYCPPAFAETREEVLLAAMRQHPLATVIVHGPDGLNAEHVPLLHVPASTPPGPGVLIGHVARANTLWQHEGQECLLVFQGSQAYISPNWYASKAATGKAVPTWNYVTVHVRARLQALQQPEQIVPILQLLTAEHEAGEPRPWTLEDAPHDYLAAMLRAVVGLRFDILGLQGKWKTSQNQPEGNRATVVQALLARGGDAALQMAQLVRAGAKP